MSRPSYQRGGHPLSVRTTQGGGRIQRRQVLQDFHSTPAVAEEGGGSRLSSACPFKLVMPASLYLLATGALCSATYYLPLIDVVVGAQRGPWSPMGHRQAGPGSQAVRTQSPCLSGSAPLSKSKGVGEIINNRLGEPRYKGAAFFRAGWS